MINLAIAIRRVVDKKGINNLTKKKTPKEYDPSKPLPNRKHEAFARALAKNPQLTQDQAYSEIYPSAIGETAVASASRLLSNVNVRQRVMALLDKVDAGLPRASQKLKQHLESETESISLDATKTIFKLAGAMDAEKVEAQAIYNPVQIVINTIKSEAPAPPQPIDIKEVTNTDE